MECTVSKRCQRAGQQILRGAKLQPFTMIICVIGLPELSMHANSIREFVRGYHPICLFPLVLVAPFFVFSRGSHDSS